MDILLVHVPKERNFYNPIGYFSLGNLLPMGLLSIADHLDRRGYRARVLHMGCERQAQPGFRLADYVSRHKPRLVGFSFHWHYQAADVLDEARALKREHPELPILFGGITAGIFADEILRTRPEVDYIIRGEGEWPASLLLDALTNGGDLASVPNLSYRDQIGIRHNPIGFVADRAFLDQASFHRYDLLENADLYFVEFNNVLRASSLPSFLRKKLIPPGRMGHIVCVGRGCPVECSYCGGGKIAAARTTGRTRVTLRSYESVLRELFEVADRGIRRLYFPIDPYPTSNYYPRLFREIHKNGLAFGASFESYRLPTREFTEEFARTFRGGRENLVLIGVESGDEALRAKNRGYPFTNAELFDALHGMEERGLFFHLCYTLGLPGETRASLAATKGLWDEIKTRFRNLAGQSATIINLDPDSPAESDPAHWGIKTQRRSLDDLVTQHRESFKESLTAWGHFPMRHECPTLSEPRPSGSGSPNEPRQLWSGSRTERILLTFKCRHFCPITQRTRLPHPLNRAACASLGAVFKYFKTGLRQTLLTTGPAGRSLDPG